MKIVGVACSPRKGKATAYALEECLKAVRGGLSTCETGMIELADYKFSGCLACGKCVNEFLCSQEDDFRRIVPALDDPDLAGIVVATPVYFGTMTSQCKAFLDRCVRNLGKRVAELANRLHR